jgi:hypothetical protein
VGNASESTTYSEEDWARMLATQREQEAKQDLEVASIKGQSAKDITLMSSIGTFLKDPQERIKRDKALMQTKQNERDAEIKLANAKRNLTQAEERIKTLKKDYPMNVMVNNSIETSLEDAQEQIKRGKELIQTKQNKRDPAEDIRLILSVEKFLKDAQERIKRGKAVMQTKQNERAAEIEFANAKWVLTQAEEKIKTLEKDYPMEAMDLKSKLIVVKQVLEANQKNKSNSPVNFFKNFFKKEKSAEDIRLIWSIEKFLKEAHERIERGGDELNAKWFLTQAEEKINTLEKNHPTDAKALKNKLIAVKKELEPNKKSEPNNLANFLKGLYDKLFK